MCSKTKNVNVMILCMYPLRMTTNGIIISARVLPFGPRQGLPSLGPSYQGRYPRPPWFRGFDLNTNVLSDQNKLKQLFILRHLCSKFIKIILVNKFFLLHLNNIGDLNLQHKYGWLTFSTLCSTFVIYYQNELATFILLYLELINYFLI